MNPKKASNRLLSARDVAARVGIHPKTFYRYFREGRLKDFPEPRLATATWRWLESEVEEWMVSRPKRSRRGQGATAACVTAASQAGA